MSPVRAAPGGTSALCSTNVRTLGRALLMMRAQSSYTSRPKELRCRCGCQSDDEKALPRSDCDKYYLCRQRGRFSRFARRERAPTNLKANGSKSIECLARHDDFSAAMPYGGYEAVVSCSHLTARYLQVEPVPEIKD